MSDEISPSPVASPVAPSPAAAVAVAVKAPAYHPFAHSFGIKLRETAEKLVADFKHERANPATLKIAKETAIEMILALPSENNAAEVKFEGNHGTQVNVIVIPHNV